MVSSVRWRHVTGNTHSTEWMATILLQEGRSRTSFAKGISGRELCSCGMQIPIFHEEPRRVRVFLTRSCEQGVELAENDDRRPNPRVRWITHI